ncbi:hypothetical protein GCM10027299_15380 [Larkinella ripae]
MARKQLSSYAVFQNPTDGCDIVFYYEEGGSDSVQGVSAAEAAYVVDLLRNEKPMSYDHDRKRLSTLIAEPVGEAEVAPDLAAWLTAHPAVANSIVWEDAAGVHPWSSWTVNQQGQLRDAFHEAWNRGSIPVAAIPVNQLSDDGGATVLSVSDAWAYFKASVGHSLAVEYGQHLPWSLVGYSPNELAQLFDSRELFEWTASPAGYQFRSRHGRVIPAPPRYSYEFLARENLIGPNRLDTISRAVDWCRLNLIHFTGSFTAANAEAQWQYRGYPPMVRVIEGTPSTLEPSVRIMHRTAGCWGTTGFLRALLRVVNIPVKLVSTAGHAQPWFMADGHYLSHGDDPYSRLVKQGNPPVPAGQLLISQTLFDQWFGSAVSDQQKDNNIGRRPVELALLYLPTYLLKTYCNDKAAGKSHAGGAVFELFSRYYTVAELEALTLWTRMDTQIAQLGGCAQIPVT